jgi:hypothetical protein
MKLHFCQVHPYVRNSMLCLKVPRFRPLVLLTAVLRSRKAPGSYLTKNLVCFHQEDHSVNAVYRKRLCIVRMTWKTYTHCIRKMCLLVLNLVVYIVTTGHYRLTHLKAGLV